MYKNLRAVRLCILVCILNTRCSLFSAIIVMFQVGKKEKSVNWGHILFRHWVFFLLPVFKDCTDDLVRGNDGSSGEESAGIPSPLTEARTLSLCADVRLSASRLKSDHFNSSKSVALNSQLSQLLSLSAVSPASFCH